ncbi:MAG: hypothetical protein GXO23_00525 [Crenarchaeota archaeon]|nr:hypothetical protein [Thermoproteota archaeon]
MTSIEKTLNTTLSVALMILLSLELLTGSCYYYVLSMRCLSGTSLSIPVILASVNIDCTRYSVKIIPRSDIVVGSLILLTLVSGLLCERRRTVQSTSIFLTFSRMLNYVCLMLLLPLPLYLNLGVVSLVVLLSNPLLAACVFSMKIPTEMLTRVIKENEKMTEIYVSVDELMEETIVIEESEYEE